MTSEPENAPRRRPPTIDLTAREVASEKPAAKGGGEEPPGDGVAPEKARGEENTRGNFSYAPRPQGAHAIGAAFGVIATAAVFAGLWIAGVVPPRGGKPLGVPPSEAAVPKEISARLAKIEAALAAQPPIASAARIAAAEAMTKALGNSLAILNRRADDIAVIARTALAHADAAASAAAKNATQAGVSRSEVDALAARIAALERAVKALSGQMARHPASVGDHAARLTIAVEALRAAVERGVPYAAELAAVKALGGGESELAPLAPFATDGLPSVAALARELRTLAPALLRTSGAAPHEASFLGRLEANAQKLVRVTPIAAAPGNDPAPIVARAAADAAHGDIAAALDELSRLPAAARALADGWVKKAKAREAAIAASRKIAAGVLAALAKPPPQ